MAVAAQKEGSASAAVAATTVAGGEQPAMRTRVRASREDSLTKEQHTGGLLVIATLGIALLGSAFLCSYATDTLVTCPSNKPTTLSHLWQFAEAGSPAPASKRADLIKTEAQDHQVRFPQPVDDQSSNQQANSPIILGAASHETHYEKSEARKPNAFTRGPKWFADFGEKLKNITTQLLRTAERDRQRLTIQPSRWCSLRHTEKSAGDVWSSKDTDGGANFQFCRLPLWKRSTYFSGLLTIEDDELRELKRVRELARRRAWLMERLLFVVATLPAKVLRELGIDEASVDNGLVLKVLVPPWWGSNSAVEEPFTHQLLWNQRETLPFILPLLAVARSSTGSRYVYMILPRARTLTYALLHELTRDFRLACAELLCAVKCLHDRGLVHRDLKVENLLVMPDGHLVLSDFETVRQEGQLSVIAGTFSYMAPELRVRVNKHFYLATVRKEHDVYSLGRTFELMADLVTGAAEPNKFSRTLLEDLVSKMTEKHSEKRMTLDRVVRHPFFGELDIESVRRKNYGSPFLSLEQPSPRSRADGYNPHSSLPSVAQLFRDSFRRDESREY